MTGPRSKHEAFRRSREGEFGNYVETWGDPGEAFLAGAFDGGGTVMGRVMVPGGKSGLHLDLPRAVDFHLDCPHEHVFQPHFAGELYVLQGELVQWPDLKLHWTTLPGHMRLALNRQQKFANAAEAMCLLRTFLDPWDFDWLMLLTERYPDSVIEFGHFARRMGTLNRRMIVWEVREGF